MNKKIITVFTLCVVAGLWGYFSSNEEDFNSYVKDVVIVPQKGNSSQAKSEIRLKEESSKKSIVKRRINPKATVSIELDIEERFEELLHTPKEGLKSYDLDNIKYAKTTIAKVSALAESLGLAFSEDEQQKLAPLILQACIQRQEAFYSYGKLIDNGRVMIRLNSMVAREVRNSSNQYISENAKRFLSKEQVTLLMSTQYVEMMSDLKLILPGGAFVAMENASELSVASYPTVIIEQIEGLSLNKLMPN